MDCYVILAVVLLLPGSAVAESSAIGPFDQWPIGLGFDYFYGFMGGDTNQWQPANLARNTTYIYPFQDNPDFNLTSVGTRV